jgi:hypothetical protein
MQKGKRGGLERVVLELKRDINVLLKQIKFVITSPDMIRFLKPYITFLVILLPPISYNITQWQFIFLI